MRKQKRQFQISLRNSKEAFKEDKQLRYTNTLLLFEKIATVLYFIMLAVNLVLPVLSGATLNIHLFTFVMLIIWTIAIVSAHGYLKKIVSTSEDTIVYDTILPIVPATLVRLVEFGWFFIRQRQSFRINVFIADVALDVLFIIILLLDKSHYYYESRKQED